MIKHIKKLCKIGLVGFVAFIVLIFSPTVLARRSSSYRSHSNDFSFKSFTGDYYISKDRNGLARMHVVETLVAEFPNFDQNHGILRVLPVTSQLGKNIIIQDPNNFRAIIKRNGTPEPYTSTYQNHTIALKIGQEDEFVQGEQTYTIEYDFENVASFFEENNPDKFQEIYWNANGHDWIQPFGSVTANVHISNALLPNLKTKYACYSGSLGSKDTCNTKVKSDGYSFNATNLSHRQGLTFVIAFDKDTFTIQSPRTSYIAYFVFFGFISLFVVTFLVLAYRYYKKIHPNRSYFKNLSTPPEFLPLRQYTIAEVANLYIKTPKNVKVATTLEMAIERKIEIIKKDNPKRKFSNKTTWFIKVLDTTNLSPEQATLLRIIRGKSLLPEKDQVIELKAHNYIEDDSDYNTLRSLYRKFDGQTIDSLVERQDLEPTSKQTLKSDWRRNPKSIIPIIIFAVSAVVYVTHEGWLGKVIENYTLTSTIKDSHLLYFSIFALLPLYVAFLIAGLIFGYKYPNFTRQGLNHANYLAGLETYIKMAEADRLKFLQSVQGADVSAQGIVKLYEKLLPYAVIFGQEKTWLKSLEHYYQLTDDNTDIMSTWNLFSSTSFHSLNSSLNSSISSAIGSSGSGFSSGGGFSGGGGGGGGGGGW